MGLLAQPKRKYLITESGNDIVEKLKKEFQVESKGEKNGSPVSLQRLGRFCKEHSLEPHRLAAIKQQSLDNLILDTVTEMEAGGLAGS